MTKPSKPASKPRTAPAGKSAAKPSAKPGRPADKSAAKVAVNTTGKAGARVATQQTNKLLSRALSDVDGEPVVKLTVNPFLDADTHTRMRDYTDAGIVVAKELKAIVEVGAGLKSQDPRFAPSLDIIRGVVKKGVTLRQMFERIAAGTEKALWEGWMATFGFELRTVNYAPTGARNACLALDLRPGSKAHAIFAAAGVQNWRSLVADDAAGVQVQNANDKSALVAYAFFYLDRASSK